MSSKNRVALITIIVALLVGAGVAVAGSQGGATLNGFPLFALAVIAAYIIQVLVWIPSALARTEKVFDLTGSGTFVIITAALLVFTPERDLRTWLLGGMIIIWGLRLGSFLFARVLRAGADDRFDAIKRSPLNFLQVWIMQALWVSVTSSAAWIAISSATTERKPIEWIAIVGVVLWVVGFAIEVISDAQKSRFKASSANAGRFMNSGLWSRSRHPNYFGEIMLWVGIFLVAAPVLAGWQWVGILSPLLITLLLTRISGIPMLEAKAEARWGNDADYIAYKRRTPVLVPRLTSPRG